MSRPTLSRPTTVLAALALTVGLGLGATEASAIPPGGASPDTPGTSSSVSPTRLRAGDTISFTLSGYPAGEIVYIKIDDGLDCSASAIHGACVYYQQAIPASGTVRGSFALPTDLAPGRHWLRMLASEPILDGNGNQIGVNGYTRRGGNDFTVVAGGGGGGGGNSGGGGSTGGSGGAGGTSGQGGGTGGAGGPAGGSGGGDGGGTGGSGGSGAGGRTGGGATATTAADGAGAVVTVPGDDPDGAEGTTDPAEADDGEGSDDAAGRREVAAELTGEAGAPAAASGEPTGDGGGSDFPLVGTLALGVAVIGAGGGYWYTRRRAA